MSAPSGACSSAAPNRCSRSLGVVCPRRTCRTASVALRGRAGVASPCSQLHPPIALASARAISIRRNDTLAGPEGPMTGPLGTRFVGLLEAGVEERAARRRVTARSRASIAAAGDADGDARRAALRRSRSAVFRARLRRALRHALGARATAGDEPRLAAGGPGRALHHGPLAARIRVLQRRLRSLSDATDVLPVV